MDIFVIQFTVKVDLDHFTHVESYILISVQFMDDAGDDMFTAVILHMIKASLPVDHTMHSTVYRQFAVTVVDDPAVTAVYIQYPYVIQSTVICCLTASLRIKRGIFEHDLPVLLSLFTGDYLRVKLPAVNIPVKQFIHFFTHLHSPIQFYPEEL